MSWHPEGPIRQTLKGGPARTHFKPKAQPAGLGDAVAAVAQPIARVIDAVAGTDLEHCGGCARRKAALNRLVPRLSNPLAGAMQDPRNRPDGGPPGNP